MESRLQKTSHSYMYGQSGVNWSIIVYLYLLGFIFSPISFSFRNMARLLSRRLAPTASFYLPFTHTHNIGLILSSGFWIDLCTSGFGFLAVEFQAARTVTCRVGKGLLVLYYSNNFERYWDRTIEIRYFYLGRSPRRNTSQNPSTSTV